MWGEADSGHWHVLENTSVWISQTGSWTSGLDACGYEGMVECLRQGEGDMSKCLQLLLKWTGRNPNFTSPLLEGQCNFLTIFHWHSWHSVFTIPGQKVTWWSVTLGKGFCSSGANKIVNSCSLWYPRVPRSLYLTRRRVMLSPPQILWFSYLLKPSSLISGNQWCRPINNFDWAPAI